MAKHLHFSEEELAGRRRMTCESMAEKGLDGLLIFRQETMYYLTGYDTMGYTQFQCLYMGADGDMTLVTRSADLRQSAFTSVIEDVRIWMDSGDANPGLDVKKVLEEKGCKRQEAGGGAGGLDVDGASVGDDEERVGWLLQLGGRVAPGERTSASQESPRRSNM